MTDLSTDDYAAMLQTEGKHWGDHLEVEASGEWNAWLDHPAIAARYSERSLIDGLRWEAWVKKELGRPARHSMDLGCGAAARSSAVFAEGVSEFLEGIDVSPERIERACERLPEIGARGSFRVGDVNKLDLPKSHFDLVFSCHSFHHFLELEHIMEQVHASLTPEGFFVLEEYVGPTQLQWTEHQMALVRSCLSLIPPRLRIYRSGVLKNEESRSSPSEVVALSPFESIRSAEIFPLFHRYFQVVAVKRLGGTVQHLLYNGIIHNFRSDDAEAMQCMESIRRLEDALIDGELLPSDFMILVGKRRDSRSTHSETESTSVLRSQLAELDREARNLRSTIASYEFFQLELRAEVEKKNQALQAVSEKLALKEAELERMANTLGGRLLSKFGPIKYRYVIPVLKALGLVGDRNRRDRVS